MCYGIWSTMNMIQKTSEPPYNVWWEAAHQKNPAHGVQGGMIW